jgi:hypothetical protein
VTLAIGDTVVHKADRLREYWHRGTVLGFCLVGDVTHAEVQWANELDSSLHPIANLDNSTNQRGIGEYVSVLPGH